MAVVGLVCDEMKPYPRALHLLACGLNRQQAAHMLKVQHPQWSEVWVKQVVSHIAGHGLGRKTAALVKRVRWKTRKMAGRKAADAAAGANP